MIIRPEILKDNVIIDHLYKPSLTMSYQDYFNRAMLFAQTNYQESLSKLANTHFRKISPTIFFEEYAWCICITGEDPNKVHEWFPSVVERLATYYKIFRNNRETPNRELIEESLTPLIKDKYKIDALWETAKIMGSGTKLFSWEKYRDHYLNETCKLQCLPLITNNNVFVLARNIGLINAVIGDTYLNRMAAHWGFKTSEDLCRVISNHIALQPKVIGLILWYAGATFGTNLLEP